MQYLVDGLLIGCVYGLAAMGMTLIWGVMDVINLAHGIMITLGSFGVYLLATSLGMNPYLALIIAGAVGLLAGMGIYRIAIQKVLDTSHLSTLLATFSVNMILVGLGTPGVQHQPARPGHRPGQHHDWLGDRAGHSPGGRPGFGLYCRWLCTCS